MLFKEPPLAKTMHGQTVEATTRIMWPQLRSALLDTHLQSLVRIGLRKATGHHSGKPSPDKLLCKIWTVHLYKAVNLSFNLR